MVQKTDDRNSFSLLYRNTILVALGWLAIVSLSFAWNIATANDRTIELARKEAFTVFNKDVALRLWATTHGGVYVPATERTPPNPHLAHIPERDLTTPSGKKLTLVNPAYMLRQIMEDFSQSYGVDGHITSLKVFNENNRPDAWEHQALQQFEEGGEEVYEQVSMDGAPYLRLMRPLLTEQGCLKCHGAQGYQVGDVRGGIGVSLPMDHYLEMENRLHTVNATTHIIFWFLGTFLIGFIAVRSKKRIIERNKAQGEIITLNKDLENLVKERTEDLEYANEQLTMLMDSLPIIPYSATIDNTLCFTYIGSRVKMITGFFANELIVDHKFWLNHIHPDDQDKALQEVEKLNERINIQHEYRFQNRDGSYRWIRDTLRLIKSSDGSPKRVAGTWQDISEEISLRQDADYRMQQVIQADKLASLGLVVAGVAHEINNPNSFITYNTPLLADTWKTFKPMVEEYGAIHQNWQKNGLTINELSQDMEEIIQAIDIGSDRINKVVQNLKDFSRLDESSHSENVNVNEVINKTLTIVGAQLRKLAGKIEINQTQNLPKIKGHFQKLEQVIANILLNAAHASTAKETGGIKITSRYLSEIDYVLIEIEDNGRGMEPDVLQKIFDPFFTTKRDSGGTGLGLSVSVSLIQEHQGMIRVISRPEVGTKFSILLPQDRRQSGAHILSSVLFIDDDPTYTVYFDELFSKREGLTFHTLNDPTQVLPYLEEHPEVILVFSDIQMPKLTGWQLLDMVKARFPRLPFIIFSMDIHCVEEKSEVEPDHILEKPLSQSSLTDIIYKFSRNSTWIS